MAGPALVQGNPGQSIGTGQGWYVVLTVPSGARTGYTLIQYLQASSPQQAQGDAGPGSVVLAGPFQSETAASGAIPQGAYGSQPPVAGSTTLPTGASGAAVNPLTGLGSWLSGLGGDIASGIEGGVVSVLKDLWTVISGPLLIIAGIIIALVILAVYFKNDIMAAGGAVAAAGAMFA